MRRACVYLVLLSLSIVHCGGGAPRPQIVVLPDSTSDTGSISLIFSSRARGLVVAINGKLVIEGVDLQRLQIKQVSSGYADIAIATQGIDRQMRVWVEAGRDTCVPVAGPPTPPGQNPLLAAGISVIAFLISKAATEALF